METFLTASKKCLGNLKDCRRVKVILGNPTCDLDSAVCALTYGFLEYKEAERSNVQPAVVPVLNVTKDEFRLKTEVLFYLRRCKVPRDLLTFRDEVDLRQLRDSGKLELVLVDHHALPAEDTELADCVLEIIDHRPQDAEWPWTGRRINLSPVGSCATLVARNVLERRPDLIADLCDLLRGPILIDTANFSKEAGRATPLDYEIMEKLEKVRDASTQDNKKMYEEILAAKTDISELTPADLLIKDLKVVNGVPIPGFPILTKDFLELEGAAEALEAFCVARGCRLLVLIGMDLKEDRVTRDIAVYSLGPDQAANKLIEALTTSSSPNLQLTEVKPGRQRERNDDVVDEPGAGSGKLLALYKQANVRATRKQILPIIQSATSA